jgi:hypothetical protein
MCSISELNTLPGLKVGVASRRRCAVSLSPPRSVGSLQAVARYWTTPKVPNETGHEQLQPYQPFWAAPCRRYSTSALLNIFLLT